MGEMTDVLDLPLLDLKLQELLSRGPLHIQYVSVQHGSIRWVCRHCPFIRMIVG